MKPNPQDLRTCDPNELVDLCDALCALLSEELGETSGCRPALNMLT